MYKLLLVGGTSGIGKQLTPLLQTKYEVTSVGSKIINLKATSEVEGYLLVHRPDIIVNLAGYNVNAFLHKAEIPYIYEQVDINASGTAILIRAAMPIMREKQFGRIILASSVLAKHTVIGTSIYSANKAFIETLARVAAAENARKNITINCLRLGYMDAGLTYEIPADLREQIKSQIPMNRFGSIENIAHAIDFLVNADYVTGTSIDISGGLI